MFASDIEEISSRRQNGGFELGVISAARASLHAGAEPRSLTIGVNLIWGGDSAQSASL